MASTSLLAGIVALNSRKIVEEVDIWTPLAGLAVGQPDSRFFSVSLSWPATSPMEGFALALF